MKNKVLGGAACRLAKSTGAVRKMAPPAAVANPWCVRSERLATADYLRDDSIKEDENISWIQNRAVKTRKWE